MNWASFGVASGQTRLFAPSRFSAVVDTESCTGCETCLDRCMFDAITIDSETAVVNSEICMGCGVCKVTCPDDAIIMREVRGKEFIPT